MTEQQPPAFIAIEGPIGVGKTTLAKRLADDFQAELILESADDNPFMDRFYQDPKSMALPTQLYFLFQRSKALKSLSQNDLFSPCRIADYLMAKDSLFAEATLDMDELDLYRQVYSNLTLDSPTPDLVVYLQAPTDVLLQRIQKRGLDSEQPISTEYLKKIADAYTDYFHYFDLCPLLIVNVSSLDIVNDDSDYQQLKEQILNTRSGRRYFNPIAF